MNVSELARRLKVTPNELLEKLPVLGFSVGERAIKIDDLVAERIFRKWIENERRERMRSSLMKSDVVRAGAEPVVKKDTVLPAVIVVRDLAGRLGMPVTRVIQQLMKAGILASQNERLDFETAAILRDEIALLSKELAAKKTKKRT